MADHMEPIERAVIALERLADAMERAAPKPVVESEPAALETPGE